MTNGESQRGQESPGVLSPSNADPVLQSIQEAEANYKDARELMERQEAEIHMLRADLTNARKNAEEHADTAKALQVELDIAHHQTEKERVHVRELAEALKEIHRALFQGNTYELILR